MMKKYSENCQRTFTAEKEINNATLKTFSEYDARQKHCVYYHPRKSYESKQYPVNICTNELFNVTHTGISKDARSNEDYRKINFPKEKRKAMESNDVSFIADFVDKRCLVKTVEDKCNYAAINSKQVQPISKKDEKDQVKLLKDLSLGNDSLDSIHNAPVTIPERTVFSSFTSSKETAGKIWNASELNALDESKKACKRIFGSAFSPTCQLNISNSISKENIFCQIDIPDNCRPSKKTNSTKNDDSGSSITLKGPCKHSVSTAKSTSEDGLCCRICHSVSDLEALVSPCLCTGSMKYVHESCLLNWLKSSVKTSCELCLHKVAVKKLVKPWSEWRFLDEKPVAIIWLMSFLILLTLNILSVIKDASRGCTSTTCIVFYVLGCTGAVLGVIFLWFWARKSAVYFKKLLTLNQVWMLEEKSLQNREGQQVQNVTHEF